MSDKPNVVFPLVASYTTRGIRGFDAVVTSGLDQRKINSVYELVLNEVSQKLTAYLAKRPGVDDSGKTYGSTGQVAYLVHAASSVFGSSADAWIFSTSGGDVMAANTTTATTIVANTAGIHPAYVDRCAISGADTVVLQVRNGSTGAQTVWYSTAIGTWTQISNANFTALVHRGKMEFVDGFALIADNAQKAVYNSDLNSLSAWRADNYIAKQIVQDEMQGLARLGKQIIAFGSETAEVFQNAGMPEGSPLVTVPQLFYRIGLPEQVVSGYTHYYARLHNKLYFVGREGASASLGLYVYDGAKYEKVSTQAIDKILAERAGSIYSVNSILFSGKQAVAIALDITTAATQRWLMYFPEWKDWFEWNSTIFTPVNNGKWFLGTGTNQHKLKSISQATQNYQDDGTNYTLTHQFKVPAQGGYYNHMHMLGVVGDTARSASSLGVRFSDDDLQTYSASRTIDMTQAKKEIVRCGSYRNRWVELTHTGNLDVRLEKVVMRVA